jgi:phosphoribosylglycinamide formyltransferase 1
MNRVDSRVDARRGDHLAPHLRVAVLASGGGSNLQALLDRFNAAPGAVAGVELVIGSRRGIGALARAQAAGVVTVVIDPRAEPAADVAGRMLEALAGEAIDLVVLAGYLHLVPAAVVERFRGRIINIHPALLPAFGGQGLYGMRVHRAVLQSGARVSGATVHLVDERYDTGPIVAQWPVPVLPGDTPEALAARVLLVEHRILPAVVAAFARRAHPDADPGGAVAFTLADGPAPADAELQRLIAFPAEPAPDPDPDPARAAVDSH